MVGGIHLIIKERRYFRGGHVINQIRQQGGNKYIRSHGASCRHMHTEKTKVFERSRRSNVVAKGHMCQPSFA